MDLLSIACEEVGLDLSCEISSIDTHLPEPFAVQLHITEEEKPDRLERMVPIQLSYQAEGSNTELDKLQTVLQGVG